MGSILFVWNVLEAKKIGSLFNIEAKTGKIASAEIK